MAFHRWCFALVLLFIPTSRTLWADESVLKGDHVSVEFVAPEVFERGDTMIALRFTLDPHWHIYWKNPGDSGAAPRFQFEAENAQISDVQWPMPSRIPVSDFTNLGYENVVLFPISIRPSDTTGEFVVKAKLEWLVCQEECLPGSGELQMLRPVAEKAVWSAPNLDLIAGAMKKVPSPAASSPWAISGMAMEKDLVRIEIAGEGSREGLSIFPVDGLSFQPSLPKLSEDGKAFLMALNSGINLPEKASFLLVDKIGSWELEAAKTSAAPAETTSDFDLPAFLILLLSAFAGGVILNLMPCVLPVLSIKFFSMAKMNRESRTHEILLYTLGVLVTFTALGGLFLALRAGGSAIGWGFQLQSPPIVMGLILLFWLMGLSFLGLFEFGESIVRGAGKFQHSGAFATGVLSVFIATPCTGPFMGTALGAAATLPAIQALSIFFFLGLGLASPFLALAIFPKIRLPKPGMWMIALRQFLAFPLFATVLWLTWVLGLQLGTDAWLYVSALCLLLAFALWLGRGRPSLVKILAWVIALLGIGFSIRWVISAPVVSLSSQKSQRVSWVDFDPAVVSEARGKQAVFVDFTAAWCVTCQLNKKAVLETEAAEEIFAANKVVLVRADWTNLDERITKALAEFERASVPLYLFYPADGSAPKILPQILTLADIEGLFPKQ